MFKCECGSTVFNAIMVTTAKMRVTTESGEIVHIVETEEIDNRDYIGSFECAECKKIYLDIENGKDNVPDYEYRCVCGGTRFKASQECYHDVIVNGNNVFVREMGISNAESPYGTYTCTKCGAEYEDLYELENKMKDAS